MHTVFSKSPKIGSGNEFLAILANRAAAVIYFIYFLWGVIAAFGEIPTLVDSGGEWFQSLFSTLVAVVCLPAFIGALNFPKWGRMEMYAGAAFTSLMSIYLITMLFTGLQGDVTRLTNFVLVSSVVVMPITRTIFILRQLMREKVSTDSGGITIIALKEIKEISGNE